MPEVPRFAEKIIRWQISYGRNALPWQGTRDPYRVWLSEIMLQQTQVATVLSYYDAFITRFPTVQSLASAAEDEVLGMWSGLGYYSRARNLHRCADQVMQLHGGRFPSTAAELLNLPGIGRSTAAAIAAFCFGERVAILDGNVRRVLTRVLGFDGDITTKSVESELWDHANALLPQGDDHAGLAAYTQGLMDLGATVCTGRRPACTVCPVKALCAAHAQGIPESFPVKRRVVKRSTQNMSMVWITGSGGRLWLERRPSSGIWGGLHCLPVFASDEELESALPHACRPLMKRLSGIVHVLTHKDLHISPWRIRLDCAASPVELRTVFATQGAWHGPDTWPRLGLPAPIRKLLEIDFL